MQVNDMTSIDPSVDYNQILPIQQKRTIAFINHFVMDTVSFLNTFAQSCESRLMEFEHKLQKVEASLLILEAQLASVAGLESENVVSSVTAIENTKVEEDETLPADLPPIVDKSDKVEESSGPPASEHPLYQRFFKMLQFGVPALAVKLKMQTEGLDPNILDNPSAVLPQDQ